MKKTFYSIIGLITMLPYIVFAQGSLGGITYINPGNNTQQVGTQLTNLVKQFTNIANYVYGAMFVVALILFFIGIMKYMVAGKEGEAGKQKEAYKFLGFGILALTVMVSIWGIVTFLASSLGIGVGGDGRGIVPTAPVQTSIQQYTI